jgi:hypothetical protein
VFEETKQLWGEKDVVSMADASRARTGRLVTSAQTNPDFSMTNLGSDFAYGENAAYIFVFGDRVAGEAPRNFLEYWIGKFGAASSPQSTCTIVRGK